MLSSGIFLAFIILTMITHVRYEHLNLVSPILLFSFMQAFSLILQIIANIIWGFEPLYSFKILSIIYITILYLSYFWGTIIAGRYKCPKNYKVDERYSIAYYITAIIGIIGTIISIKNMHISGNIVLSFIFNFQKFDQEFNLSSIGSIMWLSNFAALFFSNYSKKNKFTKIINIICFINILFRTAYLYIILAIFYYFTPKLLKINGKEAKKSIFKLIPIALIFFVIPILSYKDINIANGSYVKKIYPYTAGSFSNLAYYANDAIDRGQINKKFNVIMRDLGFGQIEQYIDKYLKTKLYEPPAKNGFLQQIKGIDEEGNMASVYLAGINNNPIIGIIFFLFLGYVSKKLMNSSNNSIFYMSIFCFFSAANFLAFSGGGHFATTRFFPAMIYIWPFIFFYNILRISTKMN